jgi:hypothetical protein
MFSEALLKFLFFDGKSVVLWFFSFALGLASFGTIRRSNWTGTILRRLQIWLLIGSALLIAILVWFAAWVIYINISYSDIQGVSSQVRILIHQTFYCSLFIGSISLIVERHILFLKRASAIADLNLDAQKKVHGSKQEISALVANHTRSAKKSISMFSGRMNYLDHDAGTFRNRQDIPVRNLSRKPSSDADKAFVKLGEDLDIKTKFYKGTDPFIRGRIIDAEIPSQTKVVLILKEYDARGRPDYFARVHTRRESDFVVDVITQLFEALWNDAQAE